MELTDTAAPAGYTAFVIDDGTSAPAAAAPLVAPTQADLEAVSRKQEEVANQSKLRYSVIEEEAQPA